MATFLRGFLFSAVLLSHTTCEIPPAIISRNHNVGTYTYTISNAGIFGRVFIRNDEDIKYDNMQQQTRNKHDH